MLIKAFLRNGNIKKWRFSFKKLFSTEDGEVYEFQNLMEKQIDYFIEQWEPCWLSIEMWFFTRPLEDKERDTYINEVYNEYKDLVEYSLGGGELNKRQKKMYFLIKKYYAQQQPYKFEEFYQTVRLSIRK